jgi:tRNA(fMet)-specific endonuclease VapC
MERSTRRAVNAKIFDTNALIHLIKRAGGSWANQNIMTTILTVIDYPPATFKESVSFIQPTVKTYEKAIEYSSKLRVNGTPIPAIDILIAAIVVEHDAILVSDDAHFDEICKFEPELERVSLDEYLVQESRK